MNKNVLRELKNHGTESFPCGLYVNDSNKERFIVKHHWHKQIEMIHLKKSADRSSVPVAVSD